MNDVTIINQPVPPKLTKVPSTFMTAMLGHTAEMECHASGSPQPEITWFKNGKRLRFVTLDEPQLDDAKINSNEHTNYRTNNFKNSKTNKEQTNVNKTSNISKNYDNINHQRHYHYQQSKLNSNNNNNNNSSSSNNNSNNHIEHPINTTNQLKNKNTASSNNNNHNSYNDVIIDHHHNNNNHNYDDYDDDNDINKILRFDYNIQILNLNLNDSGLYMCQLNNSAGTIRHFIRLLVKDESLKYPGQKMKMTVRLLLQF
ncbi:hypothetical protein HELRODRAFT_182341 [Helobdella robusta]|uniref:Ig-like domain-containing protein n=1 Tax=Helobdella robusta TaxID=6412 RepID=T1FI31_HELRO|nr:hypothetical protein HELRODRAFT_182341 [Helobdella robusta]ESN90996.1 hypothetical protein HELRODRAFT_182341 [Helobdella robusta]